MSESFVRKGDTYSIQSVTRSEGLLKIFLDDELTSQSSGKVTARGLQPPRRWTSRVSSPRSMPAIVIRMPA